MTRETTMTRPRLKTATVLGLVAAGSLSVAMPASAANWRHGFVAHRGSRDVSSTRTYTGANGRAYTRSGSTNCADGSCTRSATVTGPNGHSVSRSETITHTGPRDFSNSGSITGPSGRTFTNARQTDCGRYACAHTGTITGPKRRQRDDVRVGVALANSGMSLWNSDRGGEVRRDHGHSNVLHRDCDSRTATQARCS